jgi:zinc transport system permease protein
MDVLEFDFMRRALLAALMIGLAAPAVGIFLVQRRLALIGDGIGHVAVTGVALGLVLDRAPLFVALVTALAGALAIELIRQHGRTSGEMALAVLFYGGIAGGVVLVSQAPSGSRNLNAYLFGSIATTTWTDVGVFAVLTAILLAVTVVGGRYLFSVSYDEEFARASGLPVTALNLTLAALTAITVVVSMRIVGVLLVSALMVVPVAIAQLVTQSFRTAFALSIAIGVTVALVGVVTAYHADTPSGGTIVLLAIGLFAAVALLTAGRDRWRRRHAGLWDDSQ